MKLSDFDYDLPKELIAQKPLERRDYSKLFVYHYISNRIEHDYFYNVVNYLNKGDLIIANNSKVLRTKIEGRKETGGKVEVTLLKRIDEFVFECLLKMKNPKLNERILFYDSLNQEEPTLIARIIDIKDFNFRIKFGGKPDDFINKNSRVTLPPYIKNKDIDDDMYQTVYSEKEGSIASPTAGLHFSEELIGKLKNKGVIFRSVCLHIGIGTFSSFKEENIEDHKMHEEYFEVDKETAALINDINTIKKQKGKNTPRIILVGTTSLRALESATDNYGVVHEGKRNTNLFIYPGYKFKLDFDGLITNFHLPKSSLLMLVSALITREKILELYEEAIKRKYRFFSFGDAMFIDLKD